MEAAKLNAMDTFDLFSSLLWFDSKIKEAGSKADCFEASIQKV